MARSAPSGQKERQGGPLAKVALCFARMLPGTSLVSRAWRRRVGQNED